jgi:site-specific recombinase XerD
MTTLAPILQSYFTERLVQRRASQHTVASYRDCFCLLLRFAQQRTRKAPSALDLADIDAPLVGAFLDYLEHDRGNSLVTRNARLAAVHSLFRHAALRCPEHADTIQRVLAIPPKRTDRTPVSFLTHTEIQALLASPDRATWLGRRDHALLLTAAQTGLRVSELTGLTHGDVDLGTGASVRCHGKGRKDRITPLTKQTSRVLRTWLGELDDHPNDPLFPSRNGGRLSRDAVADLLTKHAAVATQHCPTLRDKNVTPHVLRHSAAMALLHAGTDTSVIALWLGHAGTKATQIYLHADLALKEKALARTAPQPAHTTRYRPPDILLSFLENL